MEINLLTTQQMWILLLITEEDDGRAPLIALDQSSVQWVHLNFFFSFLFKRERINMMARPKSSWQAHFCVRCVISCWLSVWDYNVCMDQWFRTQTGSAAARLPVADARFGVTPLSYCTYCLSTCSSQAVAHIQCGTNSCFSITENILDSKEFNRLGFSNASNV